MPVNGVRVLPDIPRNMPNMDILIREFETGSMSTCSYQDIASKLSTSNDGNFVKRLVKVYESSIRASNENSQRKETEEKSDFTLDVVQNQKNVEKNDLIYDTPSSPCRNNLNKKSKIFLTSFEACEVEDDFVMLNRSKNDKNSVSTWPRSSPKINMYSMGDDILNVQSSRSKKNETWDLKKRDEKLEDKVMICSSPLKNIEDTNLDRENSLDNILTSSCDSSSNNSYRNLQVDLYDFEQWQLSSSLSSLSSFSRSSHDNMLSVNNDLLDSAFQDIIVTSSKNIPKNQENFQHSKSVPSSSNFDRKSPPAIGASLTEDRSIKINNDNRMTWISALGEKLSRKKPLKKLLTSTFYTKLLNYKQGKKSAEKQSNERTSDSGFIDRFLSSSSSQKSSDLDEKPSPTFSTFGRPKNDCFNKIKSKSSRIVLTEVPRTICCKENRQNIETSLENTMPANSSKLKASCGYSPLPKHPFLTRNRIPKHPFIAKTKLDQTIEKESIDEEEIRYDAKNESELESLSMSQTDLNISFSRMSKWLTSSPNSNCDLLRSRLYKSTSALDGFVQQTPVYNVPILCNFSMDFLSTIHSNVQRKSGTRYATVSPKNLRFFMSREKSQAIERCFDV